MTEGNMDLDKPTLEDVGKKSAMTNSDGQESSLSYWTAQGPSTNHLLSEPDQVHKEPIWARAGDRFSSRPEYVPWYKELDSQSERRDFSLLTDQMHLPSPSSSRVLPPTQDQVNEPGPSFGLMREAPGPSLPQAHLVVPHNLKEPQSDNTRSRGTEEQIWVPMSSRLAHATPPASGSRSSVISKGENSLRSPQKEQKNEKPVLCAFDCGKRFRTFELAQKHQMRCRGNSSRPFTCTFEGCGVRFKFKKDLARHSLTHYHEPNETCAIAFCEKKFHRVDNRDRHERNVHRYNRRHKTPQTKDNNDVETTAHVSSNTPPSSSAIAGSLLNTKERSSHSQMLGLPIHEPFTETSPTELDTPMTNEQRLVHQLPTQAVDTELASRFPEMAIPQGDDIQLSDEITDITPLLDPDAHFTTLANLQGQVQDILWSIKGLPQGPAHDSLERNQSHPASRAITSAAINEILSKICQAVSLMQRERFCGQTITYFLRSGQQPRVIQAVDINVPMLHSTFASMSKPTHSDVDEHAHLSSLAALLLPDLPTPVIPGEGVLASIRAALALLATCILSYLSSNVAADHGDNNNSDCTTIDRNGWLNTTGYTFQARKLTCMNNFIQAPVWVLEEQNTPHSISDCDLLISPQQLADLWGPLSTVPEPSNPLHCKALRLEGGILYRTSRDVQSFKTSEKEVGTATKHHIRHQLDSAVQMHYVPCSITPSKSSGHKASPSGFATFIASAQECWPQAMESFPLQSVLLIGHPPPGTDRASTQNSAMSQSKGQPSTIRLRGSSQKEMTINKCCAPDAFEFAEHNAARIYPLGTSPDSRIAESYQLSLSGGQYVNIGMQKQWKLKPGRTYKSMLLDYCSNVGARICPILGLKVGLEMSLCTGNAQRLSLLETLKLAFPCDAQIIDRAYRHEDSTVLALYMCHLKDTGVHQNGQLSVYWRLAKGHPEGITVARPTWTSILKDTHRSACFATASFRCLNYSVRDGLGQPPGILTSVCQRIGSLQPKKRQHHPALQTAMIIHPNCSLTCVSGKAPKIRLIEGFLEVRSHDPDLSCLAFFHGSDFKTRLNGFFTKLGNEDEENREYFKTDPASNLVDLCILEA